MSNEDHTKLTSLNQEIARTEKQVAEVLPVQNPFPNHSLFCRRQKLLKRSDLAIPV